MVGRDVGASVSFLIGSLAVWAWFWWCSRPAQIDDMVEARESWPFIARKGPERDRIYLRRMSRYVMIPIGTVMVAVGVVQLARAFLA